MVETPRLAEPVPLKGLQSHRPSHKMGGGGYSKTQMPGDLQSETKTRLVSNLTKTPREQLNEFKKRNKPAVILKMKPVSGSGEKQSIILRKPVPAHEQGLKHPARGKSNP